MFLKFVLLLCSFCFVSVFSIYEDEAGKIDWIRRNIGEVVDVSSVSSTHFAVMTRRGIVANLRMEDGEIEWRRELLGDESKHHSKVIARNKCVVAGKECFRFSDGIFSWSLPSDSSAIVAGLKNSSKIVAFSSDTRSLSLHNIVSGTRIWESVLQEIDSVLHVSDTSRGVFIAAPNSLQLLDRSSGQVIKKQNFEEKISSVVSSTEYAALMTEGSSMITLLYTKDFSTSHVETKSWCTNPSFDVAFVSKNMMVVSCDEGGSKMFGISSDEVDGMSVHIIRNWQERVVANFGILAYDDNRLSGSVVFEILDGPNLATTFHSEVSRIQHVFLVRREEKKSFILTVSRDQKLAFISNVNSKIWEREEGMAHVINTVAISHQEADEDEKNEGFKFDIHNILQNPWMYFESFFYNVRTLWGWLGDDVNAENDEQSSVLVKHFVSISQEGKLFGFTSKDKGSIKWTKYIPSLYRVPLKPNEQILFSHVYEASGGSVFAVLSSGYENDTKSYRSLLVRLSGRDGAILSLSELLSARVVHSWIVDNKCLVVLCSDSRVYVFPDNVANRENLKDIFFFSVDKSSGSVEGYEIDDKLHASVSWRVHIPEESEVVEDVVAPTSAIMLSGASTGPDGELLYKFDTSNIIGVATSATVSRKTRGSVNEVPAIFVYLFDGVNGRLVDRVMYSYSSPPVKLLITEEQVVCSFWNMKNHRSEVGVTQLFSNKYDPTRSSFNFTKLSAKRRTYGIPSSVRAIGVTTSTRGITRKDMIVGLKSGQVAMIHRGLVSSIRPLKYPTIPTDETLLLHPVQYISHNNVVLKLDNILSFPSSLESTCHVLATGVDQYYSTVAPSQSFDTLGTKFSGGILVVTLIVLALGSCILRKLARRQSNRRYWL